MDPIHLQAQVLSSEAKRSPRGHAPLERLRAANVSTQRPLAVIRMQRGVTEVSSENY